MTLIRDLAFPCCLRSLLPSPLPVLPEAGKLEGPVCLGMKSNTGLNGHQRSSLKLGTENNGLKSMK